MSNSPQICTKYSYKVVHINRQGAQEHHSKYGNISEHGL